MIRCRCHVKSEIFVKQQLSKKMSTVLLETKQDWTMGIIGLLAMLLFSVVNTLIYNHNLVKNGDIIEAVVSERYHVGAPSYYNYIYKINQKEYEGSTNPTKNITINDTIMVIYNVKDNRKSRAIRLRRNQVIISFSAPRHVVVNNLSSDEKKAMAERLMAELKKRYWVKQE